ncbi:carboxymuconolactone decarboxylase family protein [Paraburkholderia sp. CNPSo 3157]|uniref:Carboxymuconolactone decarboxylase family protein n=1 Tax=Paraburkholderia franconis TaxID=2654983 RepID=A0A7X1NIJ9_9BURK|nr:carboxymuconolactone decarboxylase family protein [Paraburkholderia franconis]MPW22652.1 carboxymuconolactone decarboxylase family protein [Paraburkholderia franconis]
MAHNAIPSHTQSPVDSQVTLDSFEKLFGFVPNIFSVMAQSPHALAAFKGLQIPLEKTLDAAMRDRIAIAVSEVNGCDYTVRAHSFIGSQFSKLDVAEIQMNRYGKSGDLKIEAAVHFAKKVAETRGKVKGSDLQQVRDAGWTDAQVIEIIARVAQFLYINFLNNVFQTEIDFPALETIADEA